jgi:hypothetical protein
MESQPHLDIYTYHVSKSDFCILLIAFGIDSSTRWGPSSNIDFIRFMWQNFERFAFKKYAIALIPSTNDARIPRLKFLKYYGAGSEGWEDSAQCGTCLLEYRQTVQPFTHCILPSNCFCNICSKQPPTLCASAAHAVMFST